MGIDLTTELTALRDRLLSAEAEHADLISRVRERHRASARNLVHYVALRGTDLRPLQEALSDAGLSSLGRMEAGVLGHVDAVLAAEAANGGKLPAGFGLPPEPAPASDGNAAGDGAAGENAADDGAAEDGAAEDGARAPEAAVDDTPAPSDADTPDAPNTPAGDEPVPPRP